MPDDRKSTRGQFPKGRSGNPRGRPKRPAAFDEVLAMILSEKMPVKAGGRTRRVSRGEVLLRIHFDECLRNKKLDALAMALLKRAAPKDFELTEGDEEELRAASERGGKDDPSLH